MGFVSPNHYHYAMPHLPALVKLNQAMIAWANIGPSEVREISRAISVGHYFLYFSLFISSSLTL